MTRYGNIREIAEALAVEGHETYLVGGAVRDMLLKRPSADLDLATSARPDDIVRLLEAADVVDSLTTVGAEFGTIVAMRGGEAYEITTFRGDVYDGETRKPEVEYTDHIEDDLARRDFSINAMAMRIGDDVLIDPYHGRMDLARGYLRTPLDRPNVSFRDDPLRMLRAARFIAKYDLTPAPALEMCATRLAPELKRVSAERVRDELVKLLLVDDPTAGLDFLARTGLSDSFLPELNAMKMEDEPFTNYKDVYTHTLAVVANTRASLLPRLSALFHDVAKPITFDKTGGKVSFHSHEVVGATMTETRMRMLKFDNDTVRDVTQLVRLHLRVHTAEAWTDKAVRRYIRDAGPLLDDLNHLQRCDCTTKSGAKKARLMKKMDDLEARIATIQEIEGREVIKPPLDGRQVMDILGIGPGPYVGDVLAALLERRLDVGPMTDDEARAFVLDFDDAFRRLAF